MADNTTPCRAECRLNAHRRADPFGIADCDGIHPRDFRAKWKLTYEKLALLLKRDRRTIARYINDEISPPESITTMCWLLDYYLSNNLPASPTDSG